MAHAPEYRSRIGCCPADLLTILAGPLLLGGMALLSAYLSARRADRLDPLDALRTE